MKTKQIENLLKKNQINNAALLGRAAMIEGRYNIPWQDDHFMETLKAHQENVPGSASFSDLMNAWLTGWHRQSLKSIE